MAWLSAQVLKTIFVFIETRKFEPERLVGAGGMPSSHSALVCSLTIATAKKMGFAAPEFAIALVLASIVMYDAMGVRRAAGEQAKVLNRIVSDIKENKLSIWNEDALNAEIDDMDDENGNENKDDNNDNNSDSNNDKKLKEYLGHTPLEVLGGALLGILVATLMPVI